MVKLQDIVGIMVKTCKDCGLNKDFKEFYKFEIKGRIYLKSYCIPCDKKRVVKYQSINSEWRIRKQKEYRSSKLGKLAIKRKTIRYRLKYPEKYKSHNLVQTAIRNGSLIRKSCEQCGNRECHAHHDDYKKPLEVRWLCVSCHTKLHLKSARSAGGC